MAGCQQKKSPCYNKSMEMMKKDKDTLIKIKPHSVTRKWTLGGQRPKKSSWSYLGNIETD